MEHVCDMTTGLEKRQRALVACALATGFWHRMTEFEGDDQGDVTSFTDAAGREVVLIAQDEGALLVTGVDDGPDDERVALWTDLLEARFEQVSDDDAQSVVFEIPYV